MTDHDCRFLSFDEAISVALSEPDTKLLGLEFVEPFTSLCTYAMHVDAQEPEDVKILYTGGLLFSTCCEEDFYSLDDVPVEAKGLFYARISDLGDGSVETFGMTSEYVLQEVLPGLNDSDQYRNHALFRQTAGAIFRSFWRQQ